LPSQHGSTAQIQQALGQVLSVRKQATSLAGAEDYGLVWYFYDVHMESCQIDCGVYTDLGQRRLGTGRRHPKIRDPLFIGVWNRYDS
jgi:hypothetical protein